MELSSHASIPSLTLDLADNLSLLLDHAYDQEITDWNLLHHEMEIKAEEMSLSIQMRHGG